MAYPTPYSYREYTGDGIAKDFSVPFPYLLRAHVHVYLDTTELTEGADFTWTSDTQIQLTTAPQALVPGVPPAPDTPAQVVTVQRITPEDDQIVQWQDGSYIIAEDLNESDLQWLYLIQEHHDWLIRWQNNLGALPGSGGNTGRSSQFWNQLARHLDPDKGTANELAATVDTVDQKTPDATGLKSGGWLIDDKHVATTGAISKRLDVIMSDTKPPDPPITEIRQPGKLWVDTALLQINYWDTSAKAWINIGLSGPQGPVGPVGPAGPDVWFGPFPPTSAETAWYNTTTGRLYLKYTDVDSTQWVDASPSIKGDKGDKGDASTVPGPKGDKGDTGPAGPQGVKGNTGATGPTGPQGSTGPAGPAGPASTVPGPKGDKGDQGVQGPQGPQGPRGTRGERGHTGFQGPQGEKGDKGDQGVQGPQGPQGPQGVKGDKGDQGVQGVQGPVGMNVLSPVADKAALDSLTGMKGGDARITLDTGVLWVYHDGPPAAWVDAGHLMGPQGPKGDSGIPADAPDGTADGTVQYARQVVTAGTGGTPTNTKTWAKIENFWKRTGTELSPATAGDSVTAADVTVTSVKSAMALATDSTGKIIPAPAPFTWDANDDSYVRVPVADRDISVQARMRRCLVTDAGVVTYLDADDSTKLAGDWLRLCETTELATAYTGTHGAEVQNTHLRALTSEWKSKLYREGAFVTHGGSVWECIAATNATPGAGTAAATLDGTAGQVMVEIPAFSVYHRGDVVGKHCRHQWAVSLGAVQGGGYVTHPAFVKPDGSIRKAIYIGAYLGTGTNGNGSASGVRNTTNITRPDCRTACAGRGTGWHQLGYAEYNAVQLLLLTEYQDLNSQKVLGNGAITGNTYAVNTGPSNARGNRSENVHTHSGASTDYVSYRGLENIYGRAFQWTDGINIGERAVYVCTDPSKWADDTAADYDAVGVVPFGNGSYIRDVFSAGTYLLPRSVDGGSDTTYVADGLWTSSYGWRVAFVSGCAFNVGKAGALYLNLASDSSDRGGNYAGRLAYAQ